MQVQYRQADLKSFDVEAARSAALDNPYISGTVGCPAVGKIPAKTAQKRKRRWNDDRWHTLEFRDFARFAERSGYRFLGLDWLGEMSISTGSFSPRWCRAYQRRSLANIYSWCEAAGGNSVTSAHFVTLTVRHPCTGSYRSMRQTVEDLRAAWSGVRRWLCRRGWRYLRVMEPGEMRGYPHYHMIILGATDADIERLIERWVSACARVGNAASVRGQDWQRVEDIRRLGAYVAKYLSKSFSTTEADADTWWRWMELAYREGIRVYAMDADSARYVRAKYPARPSGIGEVTIYTPDDDDDDDGDNTPPLRPAGAGAGVAVPAACSAAPAAPYQTLPILLREGGQGETCEK